MSVIGNILDIIFARRPLSERYSVGNGIYLNCISDRTEAIGTAHYVYKERIRLLMLYETGISIISCRSKFVRQDRFYSSSDTIVVTYLAFEYFHCIFKSARRMFLSIVTRLKLGIIIEPLTETLHIGILVYSYRFVVACGYNERR